MPTQVPPDTLNAFSRTLATGVFMLVPGIIGYFLDAKLGTSFLTVLGFISGVGLGIFILLVQAKQMDIERKRARESGQTEVSDKDSQGT